MKERIELCARESVQVRENVNRYNYNEKYTNKNIYSHNSMGNKRGRGESSVQERERER